MKNAFPNKGLIDRAVDIFNQAEPLYRQPLEQPISILPIYYPYQAVDAAYEALEEKGFELEDLWKIKKLGNMVMKKIPSYRLRMEMRQDLQSLLNGKPTLFEIEAKRVID